MKGIWEIFWSAFQSDDCSGVNARLNGTNIAPCENINIVSRRAELPAPPWPNNEPAEIRYESASSADAHGPKASVALRGIEPTEPLAGNSLRGSYN